MNRKQKRKLMNEQFNNMAWAFNGAMQMLMLASHELDLTIEQEARLFRIEATCLALSIEDAGHKRDDYIPEMLEAYLTEDQTTQQAKNHLQEILAYCRLNPES